MVTFNKEANQVTITMPYVEEFFTIRKAMYDVLAVAGSSDVELNKDSIFYYMLLLKEMEPKINPLTLELEGVVKGGNDEN